MRVKLLFSLFLISGFNIAWGQTNTFPATGSVGIGTTSPNANAQLEVNNGVIGKVKVGYGTYVGSTSQAYSGNAVFGRNVYTNDYDNVRALFTNGIGSQYILLGNNAISFNITEGLVTSGSIVNNQIATFTTMGLGIGTTTPVGVLDIKRDPSVAGNEIYFTGETGAYQNSNSLRLNFVGYAQKAGFGIQAINTGSYGAKDLVFFAHDANLHHDYTSYDEVVRFTFNGNVGIGTSTPQSKLDVNGNIYSNGKIFIGTPDASTVSKIAPYALAVDGAAIFTKATVKLNNAWPDYVFAPTYQLTPLDSLERFIKINGHLPEMPTAREVEKSGIDLGANQTLLLKKIEELTLIVIEQNNEIKDLKKKISKIEQ